jgi:small-conductance mechanosensitive channel
MLDSFTLALIGEIMAYVGISLFVSLIIIKVLSNIAKRSNLPKNSTRDIQRAVLSVWALLAIMWILQILNLTSIFSTLTLTGIIGLCISLSLQSTLSNFFSGLWLINDKVLRLGDTIKIGLISGEVVRMSFRNTWLKTIEGNIAIVSNTALYNGPFVNFTASDRLSKSSIQVPFHLQKDNARDKKVVNPILKAKD